MASSRAHASDALYSTSCSASCAAAQNPMDLGTVDAKLQASRYSTVNDFAADVRLIWANAQAFNLEGSDIYELASILSADFDAKMSEVRNGPLRESGAAKGGGASSGAGDALSGEALAACKAVVRDLRKHKDCGPFLEPVDWKALGIPDYPTIIKRPMDLGTVMKRLESNQYSSVLDVAADIELVWSNAMTYNQDESYIYAIANDLKTYSEKKMEKLVAAAREAGSMPQVPNTDALRGARPCPLPMLSPLPRSSDLFCCALLPQELTFDMKRQLNENAASLSSKDLYGMVGIVEDTCKQAIDQVRRSGDSRPES